ncbi:MAG: hypothetical protein ACYC8T_07170 [Myxococcaceae bacterium]
MAGKQTTGTGDVTFDLISVLYHALNAADTCERYRQDAEKANPELSSFFDECISANRELADRCKQLLGARLGSGVGRGMEAQQPGESVRH